MAKNKETEAKPQPTPTLMFKNSTHELVHILQPIASEVIVFSSDCSTFRFEGSSFDMPDSLKNVTFQSDGKTPEEIIAQVKAHNEIFAKANQSERLVEYSEHTKMFQELILSPIKEAIESIKKDKENV